MNQPIVRVSDSPPPRHIRRQAERAKRKLPVVQTVSLRRLYIKPDGHMVSPGTEPKRKYDNWQWLVGGHWKWQWYANGLGPCTCPKCIGTTNTRGVHKRIFIAPFLKGPEDKPFKAPGVKVYQVVR